VFAGNFLSALFFKRKVFYKNRGFQSQQHETAEQQLKKKFTAQLKAN
jgi:hypothetical protein